MHHSIAKTSTYNILQVSNNHDVLHIEVEGLGSVTINRTPEGLVVNVTDKTEQANELTSIWQSNADFEASYCDELEKQINALLPCEDISEQFSSQAFDDGLTIQQAVHSYCQDHVFDLGTLEPLEGDCEEFHTEVKKLKRPYFKLSTEQYHDLMDMNYDYYRDRNNNVFTFGTADGGYALMRLNKDAAKVILDNH